MRVTSALWASALVRRYFGVGAVATIARRGAEEAGAIFIILDRLDGTGDLYGPAPQSSFEEGRPSDRLFQKVAAGDGLPAIGLRIEREARFDPDLWVVAIEDREARLFFETVGSD